MIRPEKYPFNNDLTQLLRDLQKEAQRTDQEAMEGIIRSVTYILETSAKRETPYNAIEIATEVDLNVRRLPAVNRETFRPHQYLRAQGIEQREGKVELPIVIPFPLNAADEPYELRLRTYVSETARVPGITINFGKREPIHLFFYAAEVRSICIGNAVANEYARLIVEKRER